MEERLQTQDWGGQCDEINPENAHRTCEELYNCCSCGDAGCGCMYCFDCNACDFCKGTEGDDD